MADYYPLLARALDALPDRSPAMRKAVYQRARGALIGQLRSLEPPLSEADIDLESRALEAAIERLETVHGDPAPSSDPAAPAAAAEDPLPAVASVDVPAVPPVDRPIERVMPPAPVEPVMPPAPPPDLGLPPAIIAEEPIAPAEPTPPAETPAILPFRAPQAPPAKVREASTAETPATVAEEPIAGDPSILASDAVSGRQRPRIDVVPPRGGRSRLLRNVFVGSVLLVVIGLIATAAFLLRDKPADLQPNAVENQNTPAESAESKYADRVGGEARPPERPASVQGAPPQASVQPEVAVSQRAVLYEENAPGSNTAPASTQGRVVWRLDAVPGEQGQPLETALRAMVEFPDAGLSLAMTIRRNLDATLPASHTIELAFTQGPAGSSRSVQDVGLLQLKDEENARGSPVSGLPVRVRENLFLIGLSSLSNDIDRNTDLLLNRNWLDLAVKFTAGPRAIVSFEKGSSGTQAMQRAFEQWR